MDSETAKKKWENYWYYYKWHTLAGIFVLIVLIVSIKSCIARIDPDISIILRTDFYVTEDTQAKLKSAFTQYCKDYNGDKRVEVYISSFYFPTDKSKVDPQMQMANQQKLIAQIASGEAIVIAGDKAYIDDMDKQKVFNKLPNTDSTLIKLNDTEFIKSNGIKLEGDVYIGIRDFSKKTGKELQRYKNNLEFINNMLNNKKVK